MKKLFLFGIFCLFFLFISINVNAQSECNIEEERCDGNFIQKCFNGTWETTRPCIDGCVIKEDIATCVTLLTPQEILKPSEISEPSKLDISKLSSEKKLTFSQILLIIVLIVGIVFLILALLDIWKSTKELKEKIIWTIISLTLIGAAIYFFIVKKIKLPSIKLKTKTGLTSLKQLKQSSPELESIISYIKDAKAKNFSQDEIMKSLISAGWPQEKINKAFSSMNNQ